MIQLGPHPLAHLSFSLVRSGAHVGEATYVEDSAFSVGDSTTLTLGEDKYEVVIIKADELGPGTQKVRFVSGKGRMGEPLERANNFVDTAGKDIIQYLLDQAGETLASAPPLLLTNRPKNYQLLSGIPIGIQLAKYALRIGAVWRHTKEGRILIAQDDVANRVKLSAHTLESTLFDGSLSVRMHDLDSYPRPGEWIDEYGENYRVEQIDIEAGQDSLYFTFYKTSLADTLNAHYSRGGYDTNYPCTVVSQNSDGPFGDDIGGTLEVMPDDPRIRGLGLDRIPIRCLPNMNVRVPAGVKATIQFDHSDASRPYITGFHVDSSPNSVLYVIGDASAEFVARADKVLSELESIKDAFDKHTHPTSDGPTSAPTTPLPSPSSVACSTLKVV